jgi:hypothetical protein
MAQPARLTGVRLIKNHRQLHQWQRPLLAQLPEGRPHGLQRVLALLADGRSGKRCVTCWKHRLTTDRNSAFLVGKSRNRQGWLILAR